MNLRTPKACQGRHLGFQRAAGVGTVAGWAPWIPDQIANRVVERAHGLSP